MLLLILGLCVPTYNTNAMDPTKNYNFSPTEDQTNTTPLNFENSKNNESDDEFKNNVDNESGDESGDESTVTLLEKLAAYKNKLQSTSTSAFEWAFGEDAWDEDEETSKLTNILSLPGKFNEEHEFMSRSLIVLGLATTSFWIANIGLRKNLNKITKHNNLQNQLNALSKALLSNKQQNSLLK